MAGSYLAVFNLREVLYRFEDQSSFGELLGTGPEGTGAGKIRVGHGLTTNINIRSQGMSWDGETPLNGFFVDVTTGINPYPASRRTDSLRVGWAMENMALPGSPHWANGVDLGGNFVVLIQFQGPNRVEKIVPRCSQMVRRCGNKGKLFVPLPIPPARFTWPASISERFWPWMQNGKTLWEEEVWTRLFCGRPISFRFGVYVITVRVPVGRCCY